MPHINNEIAEAATSAMMVRFLLSNSDCMAGENGASERTPL